MYCVRTVTDNLYWVGANRARLSRLGRASKLSYLFFN